MNVVGIMQGRLSPPVPGRPQAFPESSWPAEFDRARACGYDAVEWLLDEAPCERNPVWTEAGAAAIRRESTRTGVAVRSLCAVYFMTHRLCGVPEADRTRHAGVLDALIPRAARSGIRTILLPVLEEAAIAGPHDRRDLAASLAAPLRAAAEHGVTLALEMDLPAGEAADLVDAIGGPALGLYYDTGNAAAQGFDPAADVVRLAPHLRGIHIKDRRRGGGSVPLGSGDVDFPAFFRALDRLRCALPLVVEAVSGDDYLDRARRYAAFVRAQLAGKAAPTA